MTALTGSSLTDVGIDAVAIKPTEVAVERACDLGVETVTVDYEGRGSVPDSDLLRELTASFDVRVTAPVRADGFDPRGDDHLRKTLPESVGEVLVAGHPAYLDEDEQRRAVAPRLSAAAEAATDPWVGTESIERLALAVGHTQYELLGPNTVPTVRALRAAGVTESIAVYAPVVLSTDEDTILDAVGEYAARRNRVRERLPERAPRDSSATGQARRELLRGSRAYALVGGADDVTEQVSELDAAGVDRIVGYPARGLDPLV
ncbi:DUF7388 family protein [Halovenus halobia]|uniref:DUF7388 family protein n=1 Tax=Halovenus halobia TaxID=3396622 RepID=UPI003F568794